MAYEDEAAARVAVLDADVDDAPPESGLAQADLADRRAVAAPTILAGMIKSIDDADVELVATTALGDVALRAPRPDWIAPAHIGAAVAVAWREDGAAHIIGLMVTPPETTKADQKPERLVLEADQEITLRCGKASLTLTRAGKAILHGAYVSSRSTGVNRIKGGSVQIN